MIAQLVVAVTVLAQVPANLPPFSTFLKANSSIQAVATDAQGFIYVLGDTSPDANGYTDAVFVARLDPGATKYTYFTTLSGSALTRATTLTVDAAGNAYIAGYTEAADFPTAPAAPYPATSVADLPYAAKIDVNGSIVYSAFFGGSAAAYPQSIAVDAEGQAVISGNTCAANFPTTAGAYVNRWNECVPFTTKLDPTGTKTVFSVVGVGGSALALDSSGNIFIAGTTSAPENPGQPLYPTTSGAFQTTYTPIIWTVNPCLGTCSGFAVGEQYVTKLSADGSKLIYSTMVTGSTGANNAGMAVDAAGDVWLTGDTSSPDYPYTQPPGAGSLAGTFTTELDPDGAKVLLSVPVGVPPGNGSNLAFDPKGNLIAAGMFPTSGGNTRPPNVLPAPASPPTGDLPAACVPAASVYALHIDAQDGSLLDMRILPGSYYEISSTVDAQGNFYIAGTAGLPDIPLTNGVLYDAAVALRTAGGAFLQRTSFSQPASALGCVTDSPTMQPIGPVAPGQLLTLYGNGLGGVTVTFDGGAAPILYASGTQVNLQAPFELKPGATTLMQVNNNGSAIAARAFAVTAQNPGVFGMGSVVGSVSCGGITAGGQVLVALALNADGSVNTCANPARAGSQFSVFVNGTGTAATYQTTGATTPAMRIISGTAALFDGPYSIEVDGFAEQPGAISGIGQITARVPATIAALQPMSLTLNMNGAQAGPLRPAPELGASATAIPVIVFVAP